MIHSEMSWPALLALGAGHGINPAMGWLFAVALGLQRESRRAVWGALGPLAAVDARRSEEHDGVLDPLIAESTERLEILGQYADRPRFVALEKVGIQVRQRLSRHAPPLYQML